MGLPTRRWLRSVKRDTCAALANAASTAAWSPLSNSKARLPGISAWSCGAPARVAASKPIAAGSSRYSTEMSSEASCASARVSATTRATDRKSTRLNSSHTEIYTLSLHDALPICGGVEADRRRQLAVLDRDVLRGVLRERQSLGDDEGDRLADVVDLTLGERWPERFLLLLPAHAFVGDAARERLPARGGVVLAGEDQTHALAGLGGGRVDRDDVGVRAVRSQEERVELAGKVPVRGVAPAAGQQPRILAAYRFFAHSLASAGERPDQVFELVGRIDELAAPAVRVAAVGEHRRPAVPHLQIDRDDTPAGPLDVPAADEGTGGQNEVAGSDEQPKAAFADVHDLSLE